MTQNGATALTYFTNGILNTEGATTYTWDRALRLRQVGTTEYRYDGDGNRTRQIIGGVTTSYIFDVQPGLAQVLSEKTGTNTTRYLHSLSGIHTTQLPNSSWETYLLDGLGSVRGRVNANASILQSLNYSPIGVPDQTVTGFAFTGEQRDTIDVQYHRARYYKPGLGTWLSLDPFEGIHDRPMSLNGYSWVEGNFPNWIDPSGKILPFLIGAALIGFITAATWDVMVSQGYGFDGHNSLFSLDDLSNGCNPYPLELIRKSLLNAQMNANMKSALDRGIFGGYIGGTIGLAFGTGGSSLWGSGAGVAGHTLSTVGVNLAKRKPDVTEGITPYSLASNAFWGGALQTLNSSINSAPDISATAPFANIFSYGTMAFMTGTGQAVIDGYVNNSFSENNALGVLGGVFGNMLTGGIISNFSGTFWTTVANTVTGSLPGIADERQRYLYSTILQ